ncbi:hypothetical protein BWI17_10270 [Betaproteobacteria bacterium GR16-43]|nr:hypothetical protein BWI17_10270 [Betaproteobacteria bacterium GR16-43]
MGEPVVIEPYREAWPAAFEQERTRLAAAFAPVDVSIEHIGSTAVPGLGAKPIVDILVGAGSLPAIESRIPALQAMGYRYFPEHEAALPMRRYLDRDGFHVHAVEQGSAFWNDHLAFRDALRADARLRDEYHLLKRRLAAKFGADRAGYTDAKAAYIRTLVDRDKPQPKPVLRAIVPADQDLLWDLLHVALWDPPPAAMRPREVLDNPGASIYAANWGQPGDVGVIGDIDGEPIGACWMRLIRGGAGLGYIDDETPQLGIALFGPWQHKGHGKVLMLGALEAARRHGYREVSLTVHPENPARHLYERCGFTERAERRSYRLMVCEL